MTSVHHACNSHHFYYCTTCFERFSNETQRNNHPPRCQNHKCVTEGCLNFDTFSTRSCNHPGKGRQNSQWSIWKALFRLARPDEDIPFFEMEEQDEIVSSTPAPATPANASHRLSVSIDATPNSSSSQDPFSSSQRSRSTLVTSSDSSSSPPEVTQRVRELRTLASMLWYQLHNPEPANLKMLGKAYAAYMEDSFPVLTDECHRSGLAGTIKGLQSLNQEFWHDVQNPEEATPGRIQQLRIWAHGTVPCIDLLSASNLTSLTRYQLPQEPQSPSEIAVRASKGKQRQIEPSHIPESGYDPQEIDFTVYANSMLSSEMQNFDTLPYSQSAEGILPAYIDPRQIIQNGAPIVFPFTNPCRDNYEAVQPDGNFQGKSSTADSGYSSAYPCGYQE